MIKVFVNGIGAKSGGGKSVLRNFLRVAGDQFDDFNFVVAVSDARLYRDLINHRVSLRNLGLWGVTLLVPAASRFILPRIAEAERCDLVFNLSDIPISTRLPQVFFFDWPYAAYVDSPAWNLGTFREKLVRFAKLHFFKRGISNIDLMLVQSDEIAKRIYDLYAFKRVRVIPGAVSLDNFEFVRSPRADFCDGFKLLCLSRYYSHKNIEIFLPLAGMIKSSGLDIKIITTISSGDSKGAGRFLDAVKARGLQDIIVNIGTIEMNLVPTVLSQADALILPTLLETFGLPYVEAMFHRKTILTSKLPFAESVCKDAAFYFDPMSPSSIFECILRVKNDPAECRRRIERGSRLLEEMPDWKECYLKYVDCFRYTLDPNC